MSYIFPSRLYPAHLQCCKCRRLSGKYFDGAYVDNYTACEGCEHIFCDNCNRCNSAGEVLSDMSGNAFGGPWRDEWDRLCSNFEAATDRVEAARAEGDPVEIQRCLDAVDVAMAILYVFDSKMDTWAVLKYQFRWP